MLCESDLLVPQKMYGDKVHVTPPLVGVYCLDSEGLGSFLTSAQLCPAIIIMFRNRESPCPLMQQLARCVYMLKYAEFDLLSQALFLLLTQLLPLLFCTQPPTETRRFDVFVQRSEEVHSAARMKVFAMSFLGCFHTEPLGSRLKLGKISKIPDSKIKDNAM